MPGTEVVKLSQRESTVAAAGIMFEFQLVTFCLIVLSKNTVVAGNICGKIHKFHTI